MHYRALHAVLMHCRGLRTSHHGCAASQYVAGSASLDMTQLYIYISFMWDTNLAKVQQDCGPAPVYSGIYGETPTINCTELGKLI